MAEFYGISPAMLAAKLLCAFFMPENEDGITNFYLPHALEWELIHYPAPWSMGN